MKDAKEIINKMIADMEWHKTVNDDCQYQMGIDHCIDIVRCSEKYFENEIPQTNADKIRSMSDEELEKFISKVNRTCIVNALGGDTQCDYEDVNCTECKAKFCGIQKWLQSDVEE